MTGVVALLPRLGDDANANLANLVAFHQKNSPFKAKEGWGWNQVYWDVKGICKTQARKAGHELYLYFNRDNKKGSNVKTPRSEMVAFHHSGLADVAKCHVSSLQIEARKDVGTLQIFVNAYRYLDNVLAASNKSISELTVHEFKLAEREARERLADSTFYRIGQKLEAISKFINKKGLVKHKITFRKVAKRGETHTNSDSRIDQASIDERAKKLPQKESLIAVATLSNADLKGDDALFQAMTEIMFATGLRFDEVVTLDKDCLSEKELEERNVLTGRQEIFKVHEIRYKAKKGGGYRSKTIPESLLPILQKGLNTALEELAPVRETIRELRSNKCDFFPLLPSDEVMQVADAASILEWSNQSNLITYLKKWNVKLFKQQKRKPKNQSPEINRKTLHFEPLELKVNTATLAWKSAESFWEMIRQHTPADRLEDMLFITQHQRHHSSKATEFWKFTLITHTQFADYLSGRPELSVPSVFERYNLMHDEKPIRLTSHQFRHFLSTMLELCETISDIEVARYFGRKYIGDNETYDHTNKEQAVMNHADAIIASTGISAEQQKEAAILFTLVDRDEALETIGDLTTTLTTSIGLCKHDFNDSPCGKHYACLRGCSEYNRTKGNPSEIKEIARIRDQQRQHVLAAENAVAEEYHGANNWLKSHKELLQGCEKALAIEQDESIAPGEKVQIFPDGTSECKAI